MKTQYGFRKAKSTVIPLACVRRLCERAEATSQDLFLVFLDWAKAFDKILHTELFWALDNLAFPTKFLEAIKSLYNSPQFAVKIQGKESNWHTQSRGIRQGCPLSPYLFICVMHVLFEEIHSDTSMINSRLDGLDFSELAYADDTALITKTADAMTKLLKHIETHAARFGLFFNRSKCVSFPFNSDARPKFADGTPVPTALEGQISGWSYPLYPPYSI